MTQKTDKPACPECGKPASGNFCQHCGASLGGRFCNQCGEKVPPGSKFCNHCGAKVAGGAAAVRRPGAVGAGSAAAIGASPAHREAAAAVVGGQNLPWWIAGVSMFILILVVGLNMVRPGPGPVPNAASGAATGGAVVGAAPDITNMTPIEAADRLYNRVMQSISNGDTSGAEAFMPMAIAAYQRARPLNLDGIFHLSMLNRAAGNLEASLDNAIEILEQEPNHLLGLSSAAETSVELGELDEAEGYYRRIVENYDSELARGLQEYSDHSGIMSTLKTDAEAFLSGR